MIGGTKKWIHITIVIPLIYHGQLTVIAMFRAVEDAYEVAIDRDKILDCYRAFKQVVPSKAEEKQLGREFEKNSGYVLYRVVKAAQESTDKRIKMVRQKND